MKAAAYMEALVNYHVFSDGNKRTAFLTAAVFLKVNGYHLRVPHPQAFRMLMTITQKKRTIERIAVWLSSFTANK
jgi:death-on-curing protein